MSSKRAEWKETFWFAFWTVIVAVVLIYLFAPVQTKSHITEHNRMNSRSLSNMEQIAKAMSVYADNYGGQLPRGGANATESLWLLYPKYIPDGRTFLNPLEETPAPTSDPLIPGGKGRIRPEWLEATGYVYCEGVASASDYVLYERKSTRDDRPVVTAAYTIEFIPERSFRKKYPPKDGSAIDDE